ncbi:hypothetical protein F2P81_014956 [Scophthalmus maximus]|uniref:Uncharacterized protein n=1 Tax=Scophthalmus maximus TaxID=52904 RepID=A0A6A4SBW7_SCOMX|nr:hypothetical protein F2P81_014956 [Scophthalmus maximus]
MIFSSSATEVATLRNLMKRWKSYKCTSKLPFVNALTTNLPMSLNLHTHLLKSTFAFEKPPWSLNPVRSSKKMTPSKIALHTKIASHGFVTAERHGARAPYL